jgi:pimeloyl-ACP methyl ester carboxylesterase
MKTTMLAVLSTLVGIVSASVAEGAVKSVVLVHGSFADGSGWRSVADILKQDGYTVQVVQEPLTGLEADVAATRLVIDRAGPCVLVGHSWGGIIVTEAGAHPNVRSLVYVNAFQPEVGETAGGLQAKTPPASKQRCVGRGRIRAGEAGVLRGGFCCRRAKAACTFHGDLPGTDHCRQLFSEDDRRGMVPETQLRGGLAGGSDDQSRPRTIHGGPSKVPDHPASRQSRYISLAS